MAAIKDCTDHLSKTGKKNSLFIADVFSGLLLDFDAEAKNRVDIFYFDKASTAGTAVWLENFFGA